MQEESKVDASGLRKGGKQKGSPKTGGRQKGTPNKLTRSLKEAILEAAELAGGSGGTVQYLQTQALANPTAFMSLLGKVLPMQVTGPDDDKGNPTELVIRLVDGRSND
jgi:hypothetical protein